MWGWIEHSKSGRDPTFDFGTLCSNPLLSACGGRCPVFAVDTIGRCAEVPCDTPEATGNGAGSVVLAIPGGLLPAGTMVTFQGIVKDVSNTSTPAQFSVTNAVVVRLGE